MTSLSSTDARKNFFELIKDTTKHHHSYRITHHSGDVMMISADEYESLVETLELLSIPEFRRSIKKSVKQMKEGKTLSMKEVFGE